jgi:hypothetical protein
MSAYGALCKSLGYKYKNVIWNAGELVVSDSTPIEIKSHQYDEYLLDRARTQWQFGDWESLMKIERDALENHPDRAKLALLVAAGHMQQGDMQVARQFVRLAQDWGCSKKLVSHILIAGVHNSLGRASAINGDGQRALKHFESAIASGSPAGEVRLLTKARLGEQLGQLGLVEDTLNLCSIIDNVGLRNDATQPTRLGKTN